MYRLSFAVCLVAAIFLSGCGGGNVEQKVDPSPKADVKGRLPGKDLEPQGGDKEAP